ncbi:glycoside hydrolase family 3 C-terminal domain-containing protein [Mycena galopus ATCC 62051]|nr:glycoside hydrolase family 3 C-terminal domain-containing protein [Mycena galopus ATCC 62051]
MILLKNARRTLPLEVKNINCIGISAPTRGPTPMGRMVVLSTTNFPYLIDPLSAITTHIQSIDPTVLIEGILNDSNLSQVSAVASRADTCLVFVSADSGEGYITVEGNAGDRNDLNIWHGGDALVAATAALCANTIAVLHIVGSVLMESWIDHPNAAR